VLIHFRLLGKFKLILPPSRLAFVERGDVGLGARGAAGASLVPDDVAAGRGGCAAWGACAGCVRAGAEGGGACPGACGPGAADGLAAGGRAVTL